MYISSDAVPDAYCEDTETRGDEGEWGKVGESGEIGESGEMGKTREKDTYYSLPMPNAPCPMPRAPCPMRRLNLYN